MPGDKRIVRLRHGRMRRPTTRSLCRVLLLILFTGELVAGAPPSSTEQQEKAQRKIAVESHRSNEWGSDSGGGTLTFGEYNERTLGLEKPIWDFYDGKVDELVKKSDSFVANRLAVIDKLFASEGGRDAALKKLNKEAGLAHRLTTKVADDPELRRLVVDCQYFLMRDLAADKGLASWLNVPTFGAGDQGHTRFANLFLIHWIARLKSPSTDNEQLEWIHDTLYNGKPAKSHYAELTVAVTGAGPAGLIGAWLCAEAGFRRIVVVGDRFDHSRTNDDGEPLDVVVIDDEERIKLTVDGSEPNLRVRALGTDAKLTEMLRWMVGPHRFRRLLEQKSGQQVVVGTIKQSDNGTRTILNSNDLEAELLTRVKQLKTVINQNSDGDQRIELFIGWKATAPIRFSEAENRHSLLFHRVGNAAETAERHIDILLIASGANNTAVAKSSSLRDEYLGMAEWHSQPEDHFAFMVVKGSLAGLNVDLRAHGLAQMWLEWAEIERHLPEKGILHAGVDNVIPVCPVAGLLREFKHFKALLLHGVDGEKDGVLMAAKPQLHEGRNTRLVRLLSFFNMRETVQVNGEAPEALALFCRKLRALVSAHAKKDDKKKSAEIQACYEMDARVKRVVFGAMFRAAIEKHNKWLREQNKGVGDVKGTKGAAQHEEIPCELNIDADGRFTDEEHKALKPGAFNFQHRPPGSRWVVNAGVFPLVVAAPRHGAFVFPAGSAQKSALIATYGDSLVTNPYETENGLHFMRLAIERIVAILVEQFLAAVLVGDPYSGAATRIIEATNTVKLLAIHESKRALKEVFATSDDDRFQSENERRLFAYVNGQCDAAMTQAVSQALAPYDYGAEHSTDSGTEDATEKKRCHPKTHRIFTLHLAKHQHAEVTITGHRRFEVTITLRPEALDTEREQADNENEQEEAVREQTKVVQSLGQAAVYATNALKLYNLS